VHDAFKRSVPQELSRLSQVVHAQRVETHQAGAHEIGGDGIVSQHDPPEIARRAMQRPVALRADDPIGYDEMRPNSGIDIEDASINALPMQQVFRLTVGSARCHPEQVLHTQGAPPTGAFSPWASRP